MRTKTDHRFVIDVEPDQVMDALLMVEQLPDWSPSHQDARVATRDNRGRPKRVYVTATPMGRPDRQVVEYQCTEERVSWTVTESSAGAGGKGFFEISEHPDGGTEVWYHAEIYLPIPAPGMLLKRTAKREGEAVVENFIAFVEDLTGIERLPEADELAYPEAVAYEQPGFSRQRPYTGNFEPGFGTA